MNRAHNKTLYKKEKEKIKIQTHNVQIKYVLSGEIVCQTDMLLTSSTSEARVSSLCIIALTPGRRAQIWNLPFLSLLGLVSAGSIKRR